MASLTPHRDATEKAVASMLEATKASRAAPGHKGAASRVVAAMQIAQMRALADEADMGTSVEDMAYAVHQGLLNGVASFTANVFDNSHSAEAASFATCMTMQIIADLHSVVGPRARDRTTFTATVEAAAGGRA